MTARGKYIVYEGGDGVGKNLQADITIKNLEKRGIEVLTVPDEYGTLGPVQEPGGSLLANQLRKIIKDGSLPRDPWNNLILFTAARRSTWFDTIEPALKAGKWVVTTRSWISSVAYQGHGQGISLDQIRERTLADTSEAYMNPDLLCIFAIKDDSVRKQRMKSRGTDETKDTFESLPDDFQQKMNAGYLEIAKDLKIDVIDAGGTPEEVQALVWKKVETLLAS